jgi:hypothetical protein
MHYTRVTDGGPKHAHHLPLQLRAGAGDALVSAIIAYVVYSQVLKGAEFMSIHFSDLTDALAISIVRSGPHPPHKRCLGQRHRICRGRILRPAPRLHESNFVTGTCALASVCSLSL